MACLLAAGQRPRQRQRLVLAAAASCQPTPPADDDAAAAADARNSNIVEWRPLSRALVRPPLCCSEEGAELGDGRTRVRCSCSSPAACAFCSSRPPRRPPAPSLQGAEEERAKALAARLVAIERLSGGNEELRALLQEYERVWQAYEQVEECNAAIFEQLRRDNAAIFEKLTVGLLAYMAVAFFFFRSF